MTTARPFVVASADAPAFWLLGNLWRVVATGVQTGGVFCAVDQVMSDQGGGPPSHTHTQDEAMYIISGHCSYQAGGQRISAGPGSFVQIPKHTEHSFVVDEPGTQLLNFYLPAGFEMLLMGVAVPAQEHELPPPGGPLPPRRLVERLSRDYGAEPVTELPFADRATEENMVTRPTPGATVHPVLTDAATAPAYWYDDGLWTVLADGAATGHSYCLFEQVLRRGTTAPPHVHAASDEVFYVIDGEVEVVLDDRVEAAAANSLVFIPRGTVHAHRVVSPEARLLNLHAPAGFERVVAVLGEPTDVRTPPPAGWTPPAVSASERARLLADVEFRSVAVPGPFAPALAGGA